jgi:hypothetical protein
MHEPHPFLVASVLIFHNSTHNLHTYKNKRKKKKKPQKPQIKTQIFYKKEWKDKEIIQISNKATQNRIFFLKKEKKKKEKWRGHKENGNNYELEKGGKRGRKGKAGGRGWGKEKKLTSRGVRKKKKKNPDPCPAVGLGFILSKNIPKPDFWDGALVGAGSLKPTRSILDCKQ